MTACMLTRWGVLTLLIAAFTFPALARPGDDKKDDNRGAKIHVIVRDNDPDDSRAFQSWYGAQISNYRDIDPETGERIGELLQLVTGVSRGSITLLDRESNRRTAILTNATRITYPQPITGTRGHGNAPDARQYLRQGDLVIAGGYLRANGQFVATSLRVMGHLRGWDNEENTPAPPQYGYRAWGTVRMVDVRYRRIEVDANIGRRLVNLPHDVQVIVNGNTSSLTYLRPGDRVVFYYRQYGSKTLDAYRVVVLRAQETYPDGDRPYCTDPDYGPADVSPSAPMLEGRLESMTTSAVFNKIAVKTNAGRTLTIFVPKSLEAVDERGQRISLFNLREGERLRVYYTETLGSYFAQRIEVR